MSLTNSHTFDYLILDSNAFIRGHGYDLFNKATHIVTVPEVISEIKDSKARELLEKLPFTLDIRNPSPAACQAVADFATKTGDFRSLSKTDVKIIALSYMLEKEVNLNYVVPEHKSLNTIVPTKKAPVAAKTVPVDSTIIEVTESVNTLSVEEASSAVTNETAEPAIESTEVIELEEEEEEEENEDDATDEDDEDEEEEDEYSHIRFADELVEVHHHQCTLEELQAEDAFPTLSSATPASSTDEVKSKVVPTSSWASLAKKPQPSIPSTTAPVTAINTTPGPSQPLHTIAADAFPTATISEPTPKSSKNTSTSANIPEKSTLFANDNKGRAILTSSNANPENETKFLREQDDGTGWIGTSNMFSTDPFTVARSTNNTKKSSKKKGKTNNNTPKEPEAEPKVACFTTDFSMQNVLLQMKLHVVATDGMLVRTARQWVLRCMACYTIHTKDLSRLFCSRCGANHLSRVAASVDAGGALKLHLRKNYQVNTAGMVYSLPKPGKQDRFQGEILLREDQLLTGIWRQKVVKINKDVKSAFGDDVTSEVGLHLNKQESIFVGLGKGNPNARKGRERRGKKKN